MTKSGIFHLIWKNYVKLEWGIFKNICNLHSDVDLERLFLSILSILNILTCFLEIVHCPIELKPNKKIFCKYILQASLSIPVFNPWSMIDEQSSNKIKHSLFEFTFSMISYFYVFIFFWFFLAPFFDNIHRRLKLGTYVLCML